MKILILNGPNINMLGIREPDLYGAKTYQDLINYINGAARALDIEVDYIQSNHEGDLVDAIQTAYGVYDGIVMNPAAYTHTSVALLDALKAVSIPCVEVHISDVASRESFRQISYVRAACIRTISGMGFRGYVEGIKVLIAASRGELPLEAKDSAGPGAAGQAEGALSETESKSRHQSPSRGSRIRARDSILHGDGLAGSSGAGFVPRPKARAVRPAAKRRGSPVSRGVNRRRQQRHRF